MSSTRQATSSTDNVQLIMCALVDYATETGIDLSKNPFAAKLERSMSSDAILRLLEDREKAFKEYRGRKRRLINCLSPAVNVLHKLSGILSEAVGQIPFPPASALFVGIDTLLGAACDVTSCYDALEDLFEHLGSFVKRLDIYTDIPLSPIMMDMIVKIMVQLLSVLALATKQISQGRLKKFAKKLLGESEIEAVLQRLDRLTQEEARITVAQTLGVVHSLVGNVKEIMEDREASMDSIRNDLGALHQVLIEINKMKRDRLQTDVQRWLSPPDPSTNHNFVLETRYNETGGWFFKSETLKSWNTSGCLLWIHGKPGAGKSTLLSAIIEDVESKRAIGLAKIAYYYFDFRDDKKQDCYGFLSSLILQLALESDSCCNILSKLYSENNRARKPTLVALKKCMKNMLSQPGQGPLYVIIDALDECSNSSGPPSPRAKVLELIKEISGWKFPNVHLCVASRLEIDIQKVLESLNTLQISLHNETGQEADIVAYIKFLVNSNSALDWTEEDEILVINTLTQKANGMFRYVACQINNVLRCYSDDIQGVLDDLPEDLDETYERILRDIDNQKRKYAQRLLQSLLVSIRPLRVDELASILSVHLNTTTPTSFKKRSRPLDAKGLVLSTCSSLITIINQGGSQIVQFAHFSVKEFLTSDRLACAEERLSFYHILPKPSHSFLAHACLSVLLQLDDKIDRDTISQFPLAPYAARHWVDHAQFGNVSSQIEDVMNRVFDPVKPHFAAWVWLYDVDHHLTERRMLTMHPTQPKAVPLYYASLCGFVGLTEHLIAAHSPDVNIKGGAHTTPLHAASVKGHLQVASVLLRRGANPNSCDHLGRVPLHKVSHCGQLVMAESLLEIARLLVNSGANANATDNEGCAPLHAAARFGYREIAELLLGSNASIDARNKKQETPLELSCFNGRSDMARFLIDRGSDINSRDEIGFIPLHAASRRGHVDVAQLLLDRGSDVNTRDSKGWTTLHLASHNGHVDTAMFLIDRGANVDGRNNKQETPLALAAYFGHLEITRLLILKGAAVSAPDKEGGTPFHKAAHQGHLNVMKFLLECGIDVDIRDGEGRTALCLASMNGRLDIIRFLIEQGASIHTVTNSYSNPLHLASLTGHLDAVQLLIDTGTHVDIRDGTQRTALTLASSKGEFDVGLFLIHRGANLNVQDDQNQAPLHLASQHGHLNMARLLLDHGANPNIKRNDISSPLHLASANGHLKVAELLIQRGAIVDVFNGKLETPLNRAVTKGNAAIVNLLIARGATVDCTDSNGWTVLHAASRHGHLGVVKLLLGRGADVDALNKADRSAAELASMNGQAEVAKFIAEYKASSNTQNKLRFATSDPVDADNDGMDEVKVSLHAAAEEGSISNVKSLLERGMDINAGNVSNQTPLHRAAAKGNVDIVRLLIERGAEVDSRDKFRWTPLHTSSRFGYLEVSRVLLNHGANVNARMRKYWTPMHLSAGNGYLAIVKLFLERGADIRAMNDKGETPYQVSLAYGYREIADVLRKHGTARFDEDFSP